MRFPDTNKHNQAIFERFGTSLDVLDEFLSKIKLRKFTRYYFAFLGIFLITIFSIIVVVRLALWLI